MKEDSELMKECIEEAKKILNEKRLDYTHSDVIQVAIALFHEMKKEK